MHVQDRREIAFPPWEAELRDIRRPLLEGPCCAEVSVDEVVCNLPHFSMIGMILLLRTLSFESHTVHQPLYPLVVCLIASVDQFMMDSPDSVSAFVVRKDLPDHADCLFVPFDHGIFL